MTRDAAYPGYGRPHPALLLAVCLGLAAPAAAAQVAPADPFAALRNPVACEQLPRDSIPAGLAHGFKFTDGRAMVDDRDISVVYDQDGRPWSLVLLVTDPPTDRTLSISSYMVRFGKDGSDTGGFLQWTANLDGTPVAGADSTGVRSDAVELAESELRRARAFAAHLWSVRCGTSGGRSPGAPPTSADRPRGRVPGSPPP